MQKGGFQNRETSWQNVGLHFKMWCFYLGIDYEQRV